MQQFLDNVQCSNTTRNVSSLILNIVLLFNYVQALILVHKIIWNSFHAAFWRVVFCFFLKFFVLVRIVQIYLGWFEAVFWLIQHNLQALVIFFLFSWKFCQLAPREIFAWSKIIQAFSSQASNVFLTLFKLECVLFQLKNQNIFSRKEVRQKLSNIFWAQELQPIFKLAQNFAITQLWAWLLIFAFEK